MKYKAFIYSNNFDHSIGSLEIEYKTRRGLLDFINKTMGSKWGGREVLRIELWQGGDNRSYYNPEAKPLEVFNWYDFTQAKVEGVL